MSLVDVVTMACFLGVLVLGAMWLIVADMLKKRPAALVSTRVRDTFGAHSALASHARQIDPAMFRVTSTKNAASRWLEPKLARLDTVAGAAGKRVVVAAFIVAAVVALIAVRIAPLPKFAGPLLIVGLPIFAAMRAYGYLVARFRNRFLEGFPNVIDLIVRAVRAGVPVTHVITTAARECPPPLAREFQLMGDSLQVGLDLEEVLQKAMRRIEIADFSFFCVCLLLQRETGGQLGETLENLSQIVRTRREIRQKTRALTGEAVSRRKFSPPSRSSSCWQCI